MSTYWMRVEIFNIEEKKSKKKSGVIIEKLTELMKNMGNAINEYLNKTSETIDKLNKR